MDLASMLVPGVVAMIGALPPVLQWIGDQAFRRGGSGHLEQLRKRIEVLEAWSKARSGMPAGDDLNADMASLRAEFRRVLVEYHTLAASHAIGGQGGRDDMGWFQRAFLIFPATGRGGLAIHVAFHCALLFTALMLLGLSIPPESGPDGNPNLNYLAAKGERLSPQGDRSSGTPDGRAGWDHAGQLCGSGGAGTIDRGTALGRGQGDRGGRATIPAAFQGAGFRRCRGGRQEGGAGEGGGTEHPCSDAAGVGGSDGGGDHGRERRVGGRAPLVMSQACSAARDEVGHWLPAAHPIADACLSSR